MNEETQFRLTEEIVTIGVFRFWKHHYLRKRELSITAVFLAVLILFGIVNGRGSWVLVVILGAYGLSFWIARLRVYFALLKKKLAQCRGLSNGMAGLLLTDTSVVLTAGQMRSEVKWEQLKGIIETKEVLVLLWGGVDFSILPHDQIEADTLHRIREKASRGRPIISGTNEGE